MSGAYHDFIENQGATFERLWTWKDAGGNVRDLSGYTARMKVRESYASETASLELTTENGGITLGGAAGTITLYVSAAAMSALNIPNSPGIPSEREYVYDLELIDVTSKVKTLLYGKFIVIREVTS